MRCIYLRAIIEPRNHATTIPATTTHTHAHHIPLATFLDDAPGGDCGYSYHTYGMVRDTHIMAYSTACYYGNPTARYTQHRHQPTDYPRIGTAPFDVLKALGANLKYLIFSYSDFTGSIGEVSVHDELNGAIGSLVNLEVLNLSNSELAFLPSSIGNCQKLKSLDLSIEGRSVHKTEFSSISTLVNLEDLNLNERLSSGVTSLGDILAPLVNLKRLSLGGHNVGDIDFLANHPKLKYLNLSRNYGLTNTDILSTLVDLEELNLNGTHVSNLSSLLSLQKLTHLDLSLASFRTYRLEDILRIMDLPILERLNLRFYSLGENERRAIEARRRPGLTVVIKYD